MRVWIALVLTVLLMANTWANPISKLIIFGDSLSDNGNSYQYSQHQTPPAPLYFKGRYSNGPIWVDYALATFFPKHARQHLLNYAFGGAGVFQCQANSFMLRQEIDSYLLTHSAPPGQNDWFVLWIGANDYLLRPELASTAVSKVVAEIQRNIVRLVEHGAKHILIIALPDLGKLPFARDLDMRSQLTDIAHRHNRLLHQHILKLQNRFPAINWLYVDVNPIFIDVLTHPVQYGFVRTKERCVMPGLRNNTANCVNYVFLDQFHPTTLVHKIFAKQLITVLQAA